MVLIFFFFSLFKPFGITSQMGSNVYLTYDMLRECKKGNTKLPKCNLTNDLWDHGIFCVFNIFFGQLITMEIILLV